MTECHIYIEDMKMHAFHGVLPQENIVGNDYVINISIGYPFEEACESDDLNDTLNYAEVARIVKEEMLMPSKLLEHVAGRIARKLKYVFPLISSTEINIKKIAPPVGEDCNAGVTLRTHY